MLKNDDSPFPKICKDLLKRFCESLATLGGISQCQSSEAKEGVCSRWVMDGSQWVFRGATWCSPMCLFFFDKISPGICHVEGCDFIGWRLWLSMLGWIFDGYRMDSQVWGNIIYVCHFYPNHKKQFHLQRNVKQSQTQMNQTSKAKSQWLRPWWPYTTRPLNHQMLTPLGG